MGFKLSVISIPYFVAIVTLWTPNSMVLSSSWSQMNPDASPSIINDVNDRSDFESSKSNLPSSQDSTLPKLTNAKEFQTLFKQKRALQLQAVKKLLQMPKYEKKFEIVTKMFSKIFQLQEESKSIIENSPFIPGGLNELDEPPLPVDAKTLESLSSLMENCALVGDIILRMPEISERLLDKNQPWLLLVKHCVTFTKSTRLIDPVTEKMLTLVAQELNLEPRDEDFVNPFRNANDEKRNGQMNEQVQSKSENKSKKPRPKLSKGPRLSKKIEL